MNLRAAQLYNKLSQSPRKLLSKRLRPGELVADVGGGDMFKSFLYIYQPAQNQRIVCVERFEDRTIYGKNVLPRHITENPHFELRATDIDEEPLPFRTARSMVCFFRMSSST